MTDPTPATVRPPLDLDAIARLTDTEGEILAELGIPLETIVEFGREWERRCLPGLRAELDAARAELTEPATGEDVETICDVLVNFLPQYDERNRHEAAAAILAALDLPRRERALREEIARRDHLIDNYANSWHAIEGDRDDYAARLKATDASWAVVAAERDAATAALANVTSACDDLKNANDQLHVARDNTAQLLEEARERLDEIKGLHHSDGVFCVECSQEQVDIGVLFPCQTYQLTLPDTRPHAGGEGGASDG